MTFQPLLLSLMAMLALIFGVEHPLTAKNCHKNKKPCNFYFDAFGDTAYTQAQEVQLIDLIQNTINKEKTAFVVHIGDMQPDPLGVSASIPSASIALNETQFRQKRNILWMIKHPFILTPGDNDWSDTIHPLAGPLPGSAPFPPNSDPIGTLESLRNVFYREGTNTKFCFKVVSQPDEQPEYSEFIENKRWIYNNVVFVTLNTISGNNGLNPGPIPQPPTAPFQQAITDIINESQGTGGFQGRINANQAWLARAFDIAESISARGLVIFTQGGINANFVSPSSGYAPMLQLLRDRTLAAAPQLKVLFIHGNQHLFGMSKPLPETGAYPPGTTLSDYLENFTAILVPGPSFPPNPPSFPNPQYGAMGRVRIKVDFNDPGLFLVSTQTRNLE